MGAEEGADTSPLIKNEGGNHSCGSHHGLAFDQDGKSLTTVTLTNSRKKQDVNQNNAAQPSSWRHPILSTGAYLSRLSSIFSWKFLSWLAIADFTLSGGLYNLLTSLCLPLFKELGIDASRQQLYTITMLSPYALKSFIGVASDLFPIGGYNKRYLALFSIISGLLGCSVLLVLFHSGAAAAAVTQGSSSVQRLADLIVACFFAMNVEGAACQILGDGKYSELMRLHPESGSSIVSFRLLWSVVGAIVTRCYVGPLADVGYFHVLFWIALGLVVAPFYPTLRGWIPEKKKKADEDELVSLCKVVMFDRKAFQQKKIPFTSIALSGLAAPVMSAVSTYADLGIGLVCSGFVILALAATTYAVFPRKFFRIQMGMALMYLCRIRVTSGLDYFYTANSNCLPEGPHFSYSFYITLTGIIGSLIHLVSIAFYQSFISSWKYRPAIIFTMGLGALASVVDLIIVMRWNVAIGIPDRVLFLLGNATFENLVNILHVIPLSSINAKIAPPGMESAVFAYCVGICFYCYMVSNLLGSAIIKWSGMKTVGDDCNFDELPRLVFIFNLLVPLLVGIPATLLIPNVYQTEQLIDFDEEKWYDSSNVDDAMRDASVGSIDANGALVIEELVSTGIGVGGDVVPWTAMVGASVVNEETSRSATSPTLADDREVQFHPR